MLTGVSMRAFAMFCLQISPASKMVTLFTSCEGVYVHIVNVFVGIIVSLRKQNVIHLR